MEFEKKRYSFMDIRVLITNIVSGIYSDLWSPSYIVGINRGGLVPAVMISHILDVPMYTLGVSVQDHIGMESNLWMPEDAVGYAQVSGRGPKPKPNTPRKNILIVDDINDTGRTINMIKADWQRTCLPKSKVWDTVWGENVRVATLLSNLVSEVDVDYSGNFIDKSKDPAWIVFPWE